MIKYINVWIKKKRKNNYLAEQQAQSSPLHNSHGEYNTLTALSCDRSSFKQL